MTSLPETEEFERCVMCGELTYIPVSMPIDLRENYEIGIGQICAECAKEQHKAIEEENMLSTAQIIRTVEIDRKETKNEKDTVKR